ncbi:hypothetical protein SAMN05192563_1024115 [Paraburkholderia aspalathi]|uniref:Uncharacterized protein n=1 Tax=Paraburkholderia aspalathi TaxID=1324617 RepID=A0A1I7EJI5_9BURK|nr:hypothetical protein SAMN05192563_1024115 [Paraburkholderia aspalathi]
MTCPWRDGMTNGHGKAIEHEEPVSPGLAGGNDSVNLSK